MTQLAKAPLTKKEWKLWDKEQKAIMKQLKECQKNNSGIMEITMKRALQIAEERRRRRRNE